MKQTLKQTAAIILAAIFLLCFVSCADKISAEGLWENATYRSNDTIGEGSKEITVDVVAGEQTVTLTVKTDADILGDALFAAGLINDASFFDTLNGIKADWNADQAYWGFYQGDEYMMVGVGDVSISGGESYRFVYTK